MIVYRLVIEDNEFLYRRKDIARSVMQGLSNYKMYSYDIPDDVWEEVDWT